MALKVTGRVQIGRFVLEIGAPAGTRADPAPATIGADPTDLAVALSQPGPSDALGAAEESIGEAASVTGRVEHALELFTAVAQGRVDRAVVLKEVDVLLGVLERLDREGRYDDVFRLARALASLLALLMRWVALVQAVRLALKAARALGDSAGEGWARHELGTLSLGAEDAQAANSELKEALRLRRRSATNEERRSPSTISLSSVRLSAPSRTARPGRGPLSPERSWPAFSSWELRA